MRKKVVWFWFGDIVCMMVRLDFFNKVLLKKMKHCIVLYCPAVMVVCVLNTTLQEIYLKHLFI